MSLLKKSRYAPLSRQYHDRILKIYGFAIAGIYSFRFALSLRDGAVVEPILFLALTAAALSCVAVPLFRERFAVANFFLNLLLISAEALLVSRAYSDFPRFYILAPILVLYVSLISGRMLGFASGLFAMAVGYWLFHFPASREFFERLPPIFDQYTSEFLALIILAQIFVAGIGYFFSDLTGRSLEEIKAARIEKANMDRHNHMAIAVGQIAHEVNNPLAILDGGIRMFEICRRDGDEERKKRILDQVLETTERLDRLIAENMDKASAASFREGD